MIEKKSDTPNNVRKTAPGQAILEPKKVGMSRTPKKPPAKEIVPRTTKWSLWGEEDTDAKTVTLKMNLGVGAAEAQASYKSADGWHLEIRTVIEHPYVSYFMFL